MERLKQLSESTTLGNIYAIITTFAFATSYFWAQIVMVASTEIPKLEFIIVKSIAQLVTSSLPLAVQSQPDYDEE